MLKYAYGTINAVTATNFGITENPDGSLRVIGDDGTVIYLTFNGKGGITVRGGQLETATIVGKAEVNFNSH
jgi:hypothetical protein